MKGTSPSGVEDKLALWPKRVDMLAGLPLEAGMVIARAKEGPGEGNLGRPVRMSPLRRDIFVMGEVGVGVGSGGSGGGNKARSALIRRHAEM